MSKAVKIFENKTRYDLRGFLGRYSDWVDTYLPEFFDFYNGQADVISSKGLDGFNELKEDMVTINSLFAQTSRQFNTYEMHELAELISDIDLNLGYYNTLGKWLRSSRINAVSKIGATINHTVTRYQTPEEVAQAVGSGSDDAWVDIYIQNKVYETDYSPDKGFYVLQMPSVNNERVFLSAVIDNMIDTNLYGKEIDRVFEIIDNDIKTVTGSDTFKQATEINLALFRGDIPEYPNLGMDREVAIGVSKSMINFPFLTRQIEDLLASDDTFVKYQTTDARVEGTDAVIDIECRSFYDFNAQKTIELK